VADLVSLDDARLQCRLAEDERDEDALLIGYVAAARRACGAVTGLDLSATAPVAISEDDAAVVKQAMLVMISHWYENRDAGEMPKQANWLLNTIRRRRL
jgi:hypothetical protein